MEKEKNLFENTTCFEAHSKKNKACLNRKCRYWHSLDNEKSNCILNIVDKQENYTLQEVGDLFNITRMRVCQIEKQTLKKIKKSLSTL
jgi:DNA-directed RNA polymerase sigma subunit (sigma70/sigma32)